MQTIKMTNSQAYDMLTLIERTILMIEAENKANTYYYDQIKSIESAIRESCPELVKKWDDLRDLIRSTPGMGLVLPVKQACDNFDKWLNND